MVTFEMGGICNPNAGTAAVQVTVHGLITQRSHD
jgi:hypothetical protein